MAQRASERRIDGLLNGMEGKDVIFEAATVELRLQARPQTGGRAVVSLDRLKESAYSPFDRLRESASGRS